MSYNRNIERDELDAIPCYAVPEGLIKLLKNNLNGVITSDDVANKWRSFLKMLTELDDFEDDNYFQVLEKLLYLEECFDSNSMEDVKKKEKVKLLYTKELSYFKIRLKNLEQELCFLKEDSIVEVQNVKMFPDKKSSNQSENVEKHVFKVTKILPECIIVKAERYGHFRMQHDQKDFYYIEFEYSNWPIRVCMFAIEKMKKSIDLLQLYTKRTSYTPKTLITSFFNKNIEKNPEQMQAIEHIVGGTSYPSPYLLFGPPGTGKTATIVEAVYQLSIRGDNVLICTPSNAAADEIARRLLDCNISSDLIYRMTSNSVEQKDVPEDVKLCMFFNGGEIEYLHSSEIEDKRIVISTLVSGARFLRLPCFTNFFNYVFIDEAGQATQPETFIPFAVSTRHHNCKIVMSGDPKQLGPVVMTKHGDHLLKISMLERLMNKSDLYKKDYDNQYDPNFITKLVQNYRSHETILRLPNEMFYDNELRPLAENVKIAENWNKLPRKGFPIIFHSVFGYEKKNFHSVANEAEAKIVMRYVEKLLDEGLEGIKLSESNIGIVTPFRYQKSIIKSELEKKELSKITVGTVESFQGQERDVIIVSLVRSSVFQHDGKCHVGFLSDEKRFNVTITRAKCLLIVIGHPRVLQIADCWRKFITYCKDNKACCGSQFTMNQKGNRTSIDDPFLLNRNRGIPKKEHEENKNNRNRNRRTSDKKGSTVDQANNATKVWEIDFYEKVGKPARTSDKKCSTVHQPNRFTYALPWEEHKIYEGLRKTTRTRNKKDSTVDQSNSSAIVWKHEFFGMLFPPFRPLNLLGWSSAFIINAQNAF